MLQQVRENPLWLEEFRTYLREKGFQPEELGGADAAWSDIFPIGASAAKELPARRLFYWTMRFFPESASRGHKLAREALDRAFNRPMRADVNWNNWLSQWYAASPNKKIANNPIADPDAAMGSFDWMESGRTSAHTLWSEDWFGDQSAQTWSLYGDLLRSASMLGKQQFGSYVIGATIGGHAAGATYKMMSLLGHGGKAIDVYTFGPNLLFADGWSENWWVYRPIADALRLVGRSERLLYPGRPERGKVAILLPGSSALWEKDQHHPHYNQEMWGLHHALVYGGYSVDFVDETDLAQGALGPRGYTTLYVTGPNVARAAQEQIKQWVQSGGTLVVTPGGAVADEYNTPTAVLDAVLGLKNRVAVRDAAPQISDALPMTGALTLASAKIGTGSVNLRGPVTALNIERAAVLASLKTGGAGITANQYGNCLLYTSPSPRDS